MSKIIKLKQGLDIHLIGKAAEKLTKLPVEGRYSVKPTDFHGVTPKLLVKVDDPVKAGTPLFFDKYRPEVVFTSPVSGKVEAVVRGDKRKLLEVVIAADGAQDSEAFDIPALGTASRQEVAELMLRAGLWPFMIQRPYGVIANPADKPKSVFISGFDSAPLAPDMNFVLSAELDNLNTGVEVLSKLTDGKVHMGLRAGTDGVLNKVAGVEQHFFDGPHPAGNVGVQIHHIDPISKGEVVWTIDVQNLAILGRVFRSKTIAVAGSEIVEPRYFSIVSGAAVSSIVKKSNIQPQEEGATVRFISGNVLTGAKVAYDNYVGFYGNMITAIPEGDKYEFLGWAMPRFDKFSVSRTYFSWLTPNRKYNLDTNLHGGERPFVVNGLYEKYLPMDIYVVYLLKAILAGDLDKMENLGLYEVIEEDLALCEFVDPSKTEMQAIVRQGIDLMIKELN